MAAQVGFVNTNTALTSASSTTLNGAQTVNTGSNLCAVCYVFGQDQFTDPITIDSVTLGGVAMNAAGTALETFGGIKMDIYTLTTSGGLTTGTPTLNVSFTAQNGAVLAAAAVVSVYDTTNQTTPVRPSSFISSSGVSNGSANYSVDITSGAGDRTTAFSVSNGGTVSTNRTERLNVGTGGKLWLVDDAAETATPMTHQHNTTFSSTTIGMVGISLQLAVSAYTLTVDTASYDMTGQNAILTYTAPLTWLRVGR